MLYGIDPPGPAAEGFFVSGCRTAGEGAGLRCVGEKDCAALVYSEHAACESAEVPVRLGWGGTNPTGGQAAATPIRSRTIGITSWAKRRTESDATSVVMPPKLYKQLTWRTPIS